MPSAPRSSARTLPLIAVLLPPGVRLGEGVNGVGVKERKSGIPATAVCETSFCRHAYGVGMVVTQVGELSGPLLSKRQEVRASRPKEERKSEEPDPLR